MMIDKASVVRQNRKTLKIVINEKGDLTVYSPLNFPYKKIEEILIKKQNILNKKIEKIKVRNNKFSDIINFNKVFLLGKEYIVIPTQKMSKVHFTEDSFLIPEKYINSGKVAYYVKKILRDLACRIIPNRVDELISNNNLKFKYSKIVLGNFKSKWGSCDNFSVIKFNWKLIMAKPEVIDFVILHELTHLKELNHSRKFYEILNSICPNWKILKKNLSEIAFLLNLY